MIKQMISLDPGKRQSFESILVGARGEVLPDCFYAFLHEYISSIGDRPLVLSHPSPPPPVPTTTSATPGLSFASTMKPGNTTATSEALPSDSDYRIERIWEDYTNIEPFLTDTDVERTIMDVRVDYHTASTASPNTHQVHLARRLYFSGTHAINRNYSPSHCTFLHILPLPVAHRHTMGPLWYSSHCFWQISATVHSPRRVFALSMSYWHSPST